MRAIVGALLLFFGLASAAFAQPANLVRATAGHLYFNRPGADVDAHNRELSNCMRAWFGGVRPARSEGRGILEDLMNDARLSNWERARRAVNVEHCMVVRGWRLMRLSEADGRRVAGLTGPAFAAELGGWVGADAPPGEVARVWANEAARGAVLAQSPRSAARVLLSERLLEGWEGAPSEEVQPALRDDREAMGGSLLAPSGAGALPWSARAQPMGRSVRTADLDALSAPPAGHALVLVVSTGPRANRTSLFGVDLAVASGGDVEDYFNVHVMGGERIDGGFRNVQALVIPAGEWRLYGYGAQFDYCMGAPSFTAGDGEVLFLGSFDFGAAALTPNMSVDAIRAALPADSPVRDAIRPAEWLNGATWPCRMMHLYALEFAGVEFRDGYTWGSRAQR